MDEAAVVARAREGDELAFELIVRRHTDAVWGFACSVLGDRFAAEDVVQDTFLKAYRALGSYRAESSLRTWLLAICHRSCLDAIRRRRQVVPLDEARRRRTAEATTELRLLLSDAVDALPADERVAFTLVDVLGHSREEAAVVVGVPASTMRSRVTRARARLADALAAADIAEEGS